MGGVMRKNRLCLAAQHPLLVLGVHGAELGSFPESPPSQPGYRCAPADPILGEKASPLAARVWLAAKHLAARGAINYMQGKAGAGCAESCWEVIISSRAPNAFGARCCTS